VGGRNQTPSLATDGGDKRGISGKPKEGEGEQCPPMIEGVYLVESN